MCSKTKTFIRQITLLSAYVSTHPHFLLAEATTLSSSFPFPRIQVAGRAFLTIGTSLPEEKPRAKNKWSSGSWSLKCSIFHTALNSPQHYSGQRGR